MCILISVPITALILFFVVQASHRIVEMESEEMSMETEMRGRLESEVGLTRGWNGKDGRGRKSFNSHVSGDEGGETEREKEDNDRQISFLDCLWFLLGTCVAQGGSGVGNCDPGRILVAFWWMIIIILAATYSGNLIGFLAFPESIWRVNSLDDLLTPNAPRAMIITGSWFHQQLQVMSSSFSPHIYPLHPSNDHSLPKLSMNEVREREIVSRDEKRERGRRPERIFCWKESKKGIAPTQIQVHLLFLQGELEMDFLRLLPFRVVASITFPSTYNCIIIIITHEEGERRW